MINNEVYGRNGVTGYRCIECGGVFQMMWGNVCNGCTRQREQHREKMNAIARQTRAIELQTEATERQTYLRLKAKYEPNHPTPLAEGPSELRKLLQRILSDYGKVPPYELDALNKELLDVLEADMAAELVDGRVRES